MCTHVVESKLTMALNLLRSPLRLSAIFSASYLTLPFFGAILRGDGIILMAAMPPAKQALGAEEV